jgi:hypothetical protein
MEQVETKKSEEKQEMEAKIMIEGPNPARPSMKKLSFRDISNKFHSPSEEIEVAKEVGREVAVCKSHLDTNLNMLMHPRKFNRRKLPNHKRNNSANNRIFKSNPLPKIETNRNVNQNKTIASFLSQEMRKAKLQFEIPRIWLTLRKRNSLSKLFKTS